MLTRNTVFKGVTVKINYAKMASKYLESQCNVSGDTTPDNS